ncbi:M20/M25/M40 family metallo-hydrolase [Sphingosinicella sp. BN140058]|uniref:M20/M25/M40 family metallo-hydrolase n=1 Tax=Sphingosinicella sp. BN140058 TaxID=1892855 RepID=UPI0010128115|nr:M20/M25/M40 family metallo-hydrolase [Sphingosinicella sp. BN140058]QAY78664.1 M20/M25/M40 family metallo-hydrolase [Sphingosinicella sp. BN140058]
MKRGLIAALILGLALLALAFKGALLAPPPVRAPAAGQFDTARAMGRLTRILGDERPHPVDSAANDAVRERLLTELRTLGLTPVVTDGIACGGLGAFRVVTCARVRNVRATINPNQSGSHLLIASHYDSTPAGPGAGDDGIGVAAALEIAALVRARNLQRPVTLLFTDGEEAGLLGARFFVDRDPLAARVGAVVNMEARGVTGPAIMFETSRPNAPAITAFARSTVRPVASSMTADAYALIPNATDVTVFAGKPWTMLNFALIGNESRYHSADDSIAGLDRRSVQHMGDQALAATLSLADGTAPAASGTVLYADLLGRLLVHFPLWVGMAALAGLTAVFALLTWRRRAGIGRAVAAILLSLVGSVVVTLLGAILVGTIKGGYFWRAHPEVMSSAIDISAAATAAALLLWLKPAATRPLRAAFWLLFLLIGGLIALRAPGGAIFFLAPPAVAAAGMALHRYPHAERIGALLAWLLLLLTWGPILHLAEVLLDFRMAWAFAPVAAIILLPLLIELWPLLRDARRGPALLVCAAAAGIGWAMIALAPAYGPERKQQFRIDYAWNADARKGQWLVSHDGGPLPARVAARTRDDKLPWSPAHVRTADAPAVQLGAPSLEKLAEHMTAEGRRVRLRLHSGGAESLFLRADPDAGLHAIAVAGTTSRFGTGGKEEHYLLTCNGRSCDGLVFELTIGGRKQVDVLAVSTRSGLPAGAAWLVDARPADAAPQYAPDRSLAFRKLRV